MTSKQEKLAAARRKLKEFQGKNKEGEVLKSKNITAGYITNKNYPHSNNDSLVNENLPSSQPNFTPQPLNVNLLDNKYETSIESQNLITENHTTNDSVLQNSSMQPPKLDFGTEIVGSNNFINSSYNEMERKTENQEGILLFNDGTKEKPIEENESLNKNLFDNNSLNDVVKPLQLELQNHAQTISILVQQRNEAQTALDEAQKCLRKCSEEAEELKQQIQILNTSKTKLEQKLFDAEDVIMKLKLVKETNMQKLDELNTLVESFQSKMDLKQEELEEMKRKYEDKNNTCQKLLFSLHEAQSQISLYQIQLQQYSAEGHSGLAVQVSELQNENLSLKQKVMELEKKLDIESKEKEESSQKFHIYAQQCNSQMNSLNSQIKSLQEENENLKKSNSVMRKNLEELEHEKEKPKSEKEKTLENEIVELQNKFSALSEKNESLNDILKNKEEEYEKLLQKLESKESELQQILERLNDLQEENKKLASEAETPKVNERLLATMESDKVAASKAVSQNQKLKEQVAELEQAFMKLSEEKLELTNQLAHEKHVNTELQNLLKKSESDHHHDHDHDHDHECLHESGKPEPLVNDSNEIEELRHIIRQLQDDKMELTARLNAVEQKKTESSREEEKEEREKEIKHCDHKDAECENTKLLLQQMEEKVRKTMNEIAVLDEEKEKLEHLVLQLQGETETIGEYITLYQKQRMILRQRAQQKDIQLMQLSKDKEELKAKLMALDDLVQHLIAEKEANSGTKTPVGNAEVKENTVGKIRALITEIESTTLINSHSLAFEHCSCCSGRLITI